MRTYRRADGTLEVGGIVELVASNAALVRDGIREQLVPGCPALELDLSGVTFLDSSGLGALISLHKTLRASGAEFRIINAAPNVVQLLELTRLHRVFQLVTR